MLIKMIAADSSAIRAGLESSCCLPPRLFCAQRCIALLSPRSRYTIQSIVPRFKASYCSSTERIFRFPSGVLLPCVFISEDADPELNTLLGALLEMPLPYSTLYGGSPSDCPKYLCMCESPSCVLQATPGACSQQRLGIVSGSIAQTWGHALHKAFV